MKLICPILFYLFVCLTISSCETTRDVERYPTLNIYQPPTLILPKGTKIQTKEGIYTSQTEEVWHSDKRYRELERESY